MKQAYQRGPRSDPAMDSTEQNAGNQFYQKGDSRVDSIWTSQIRTGILMVP